MTLLDYAERAGIENLKERSQNADAIHKEANTLLALILSGAGAALYFSANESSLAALIVSFWLFCVALILATKCLLFRDYPPVWNEPKNLTPEGYTLDEVRGFEIQNLQQRIEQATASNYTTSSWLNKCILAACATPLIGIIAWAVFAPGFFA